MKFVLCVKFFFIFHLSNPSTDRDLWITDYVDIINILEFPFPILANQIHLRCLHIFQLLKQTAY